MASFDFTVDCSRNAQNTEIFDRLASIGSSMSQVDDIKEIGMNYVGPEITPQKKEARIASVEPRLPELGFTDGSDPDEGMRRFVRPQGAQVAVAKKNVTTTGDGSIEKDATDEETLTHEEDQMDKVTITGEEHADEVNRSIQQSRIAEESRIAQQCLDYEEVRVSRGFEYFRDGLPRGSWGKGPRR